MLTLYLLVSSTLTYFFSNKIMVIMAGIHLVLVRIANREDPGSALFVYAFLKCNLCLNFRTVAVCALSHFTLYRVRTGLKST